MARPGGRSSGSLDRKDTDRAGRVRNSTGPSEKPRKGVSTSPAEDAVTATSDSIPARLYSRQQPSHDGDAMDKPLAETCFFSAAPGQQAAGFRAGCPAQQDPAPPELRQT